MKSYYSLIRYFNNSLSKENIVIGVIALSNTRVFYRFSDLKIKLISKLSDHKEGLLNFNIKKIKERLDLNVNNPLFIEENANNLKQYIDRLSVYTNGIIHFDKPIELKIDINESFFNKFYDKYIGEFKPSLKNRPVDFAFINRVQNNFSAPLADIIDIDYKIEQSVIPSLFFDYKLNGIGVNGSIYSVKCIDINSNRTLDTIQKDISELECLTFRLNKFSEDKVAHPENNQHFLVIDAYTGRNEKFIELYNTLIHQNNEMYHIVDSNKLEEVTAAILKANATKFSELVQN